MEWENTYPQRHMNQARSASFVATVSGEKWQIKVVRDDAGAVFATTGLPNPKSFVPDYEIASYDGSRFYLVTSLETEYRSRASNGTAALAYRGNCAYPAFASDTKTIVLWTLYGSAAYFAQGTSGLGRSLEFDHTRSQSGGEPRWAKWQRSASPPFLPTAIDVTTATNPLTADPTSLRTNVSIRVLEVTNAGALVLPVRARAEYYIRFVPAQGAAEATITRRLHVWATNVTAKCTMPDFVPALPDPTNVTEARGNPMSGVRYATLTTNRWPSELAARWLVNTQLQPGEEPPRDSLAALVGLMTRVMDTMIETGGSR
jgi:hypothetical protein